MIDIPAKYNRVTLNVTWACDRKCPKCMQRKLLEWHGDYQMSMDEIETFIAATGDHRFETITICGGEPLLWNNLEEGVARLRESGITHRLEMFSNGMNAGRITGALMRNLDRVRISLYDNNRAIIDSLGMTSFPHKIHVADRRVHLEPPTELLPAEQVMPAECNCPGWMVCAGQAFACANVPAVLAECRISHKAFPDLSCALKPGYLEHLLIPLQAAHDLCRGCLGNIRLREAIDG